MKKALSIILTVSLVLTMFVVMPLTAEAKKFGDFVYTVTDGKAEITSYTGSATELIIPSEFDGTPVTGIGRDSFENCSTLTSVTIPDSVTMIGMYAFYECNSLKNAIIGNSVTTIDEHAFSWCSKLESVIIGNSVETIRGYAFEYCSSLVDITFPDSLTTVKYQAFEGTAWLNSQPDGVVYAGNVAYDVIGECPADVTLKEGTKGIASLAFYECSSLKSITFPDSVKTIENRAFEGCGSIKKITIPDSVVHIGERAFQSCKALESLTIGNSVDTIDEGAFSGCVSLESVIIPASVNKIESYAFYNCVSLESVIISDSVTKIGYSAFEGCVSLEKATILNSEALISYCTKNCNVLTICGYRGSTAEKYANDLSIPFIPLDGEPPTQAPTEPEIIPVKGDIDGDGEVSILDTTYMQRYLAGLQIPDFGIGEPIE